MLRKSNWLILSLWYLVAMLNGWSSPTGGFNCSCAPDYLTEPLDYTHCKAAEGNVSLMTVNWNSINLVGLDGQVDMVLRPGERKYSLTSLDFDFRTGTVFAADYGSIFKFTTGNSKKQTYIINRNGELSYTYLAVDWIYNHIYWTDFKKKTIELTNFESNIRKTIINDGLDYPRHLAVDPREGWMFWSDFGGEIRIERAGMDGSHRSIIIDTEISYPTGLTLDLVKRKLYWLDQDLYTIASCNYDGSGRRVILYSPDSLSPWSRGLTTFEDHIFWINANKDTILKANKFTGDGVQAVTPSNNLIYSDTLRIYHPSTQPDGKNHCKSFNARCSHLCLPAPKINSTSPLFACACPDGLTCIEKAPGSSEQQTSICDRIGITTGQQNILEIQQVCQALKVAEQREILLKSQLEGIMLQNLESAREQEEQCQQRIKDSKAKGVRNCEAISSLIQKLELE